MKKTSTKRNFRSINGILTIIIEAVLFLVNLPSDLSGRIIELVEIPALIDSLFTTNLPSIF